MKKKIAIINFILMLSVVFAVSYQLLHFFSHHHVEKSSFEKSLDSKTKSISNHKHCSVCEFHFADFLQSNLLSFECFTPIYETTYSFSIQENVISYSSLFVALRGPPSLI
jgi:protein-arginine kinase activator protein McsA